MTLRFPKFVRRAFIGFVAAGATACAIPAASAQALTVAGEEIASADLLKAAKAEGSLLLYSVNFEDLQRQLLDEFQKDTGLKAEAIRLSAGRLYERVMSEHAGGQLKADIIDLSDLLLQQRLVRDGIVVAHKVPSWDFIPASLKSPDGAYYGINRYPAILGFNTKMIPKGQEPKSWAGTLDPRLKGQVGIAQAASGGSTWSVAMFQRKVVDPKFWEKQAANEARIYPSYAPMSDELGRGELSVATTTVGLILNLIKSGAPVSANFPTEGAPTVAVWSSVAAKAPHPNAARLWANWVTSKRGGNAIAAIFADYAAHSGVQPPDLSKYGITLPPADKLWMADQKESDELREKWIPEWDKIFRA
jgi:iron(III) transport system substrate-binding protein